jgi:hypothetical protein
MKRLKDKYREPSIVFCARASRKDFDFLSLANYYGRHGCPDMRERCCSHVPAGGKRESGSANPLRPQPRLGHGGFYKGGSYGYRKQCNSMCKLKQLRHLPPKGRSESLIQLICTPDFPATHIHGYRPRGLSAQLDACQEATERLI